MGLGGQRVAPNHHVVRLSPGDGEQLGGVRSSLERELAEVAEPWLTGEDELEEARALAEGDLSRTLDEPFPDAYEALRDKGHEVEVGAGRHHRMYVSRLPIDLRPPKRDRG